VLLVSSMLGSGIVTLTGLRKHSTGIA